MKKLFTILLLSIMLVVGIIEEVYSDPPEEAAALIDEIIEAIDDNADDLNFLIGESRRLDMIESLENYRGFSGTSTGIFSIPEENWNEAIIPFIEAFDNLETYTNLSYPLPPELPGLLLDLLDAYNTIQSFMQFTVSPFNILGHISGEAIYQIHYYAFQLSFFWLSGLLHAGNDMYIYEYLHDNSGNPNYLQIIDEHPVPPQPTSYWFFYGLQTIISDIPVFEDVPITGIELMDGIDDNKYALFIVYREHVTNVDKVGISIIEERPGDLDRVIFMKERDGDFVYNAPAWWSTNGVPDLYKIPKNSFSAVNNNNLIMRVSIKYDDGTEDIQEHAFTILENHLPGPRITNGRTNPGTGIVGENVEFLVDYYSIYGITPDEIRLIIGSNTYNMVYFSGNPTTGATYSYEVQSLSLGSYGYYFEGETTFQPGNQTQGYYEFVHPYEGELTLEVINPEPELINGYINPNTGNTTTDFQFFVTYRDINGDPPDPLNSIVTIVNSITDPIEMTPSGGSYAQGVVYYSDFISFNEPGTYEFHFEGQQGTYELRYPEGSGELQFVVNPPPPPGLTLELDPSTVNVYQEIICTATVLDGLGNPIVNTWVTFSDNGYSGEFLENIQQLTNSNGIATNAYEPAAAGQGNITATATGGMSDTQPFTVLGGDILITFMIRWYGGPTWSYWVDFVATYQNSNPVNHEDVTLTTNAGYFNGQPGNTQVTVETDNNGYPMNEPSLTIPESSYPNGADVEITWECLGSTGIWYGHLGGEAEVMYPFQLFTHGGIGLTEAVTWDPVNDILATGYGSQTIKTWDPDTWELIRTITISQGNEITDMDFSPDGNQIVCVLGGRIFVVDVNTGAQLIYVSGYSGLKCVDWAPNGSYIAIGSTNGNVYLFNTSINELDSYDCGHSVKDVEFHHNSTQIATALYDTYDNQFLILNRSGNSLNAYSGYPTTMTDYECAESVSFSPSGSNIAFAAHELCGGVIENWTSVPLTINPPFDPQYQNRNKRTDWCPLTSSVNSSYNKILCGSNDKIVLYDAVNGSAWRRCDESGTSDRHAVWSTDGEYIAYATGSGVNIIALYDNIPPEINITSHSNNQQVFTSTITLEGSTSDENMVYYDSVYVNQDPGINLLPQNFIGTSYQYSQEISLDPGTNSITVAAQDGPRNRSFVEIIINYVTDPEPPIISWGNVEPEMVEIGDNATITARTYDVFTGLTNLEVYGYITSAVDDTFDTIQLYDDGTHGDLVSGDSIFTNTLTTIGYSEGFYNLALSSEDTNGYVQNASNVHPFMIIDYPEITNIQHTPEIPTNLEPVTVTANATDGSGIASVQLYYSFDNQQSFISVSMDSINPDEYEGEIPAASVPTVYFYIHAIDIYTNTTNSDTQSYQVELPPTITLNFPNGGETWYIDSSATVDWDYTNLEGNIDIELNRAYPTGDWELLTDTVDISSGSWEWDQVTSDTTSYARIRLTSQSNPSVSDVSNGNFSIEYGIPPSILVVSPNGGETWVIGEPDTVEWSFENLTGNISIELNRDYPAGEWDTLAIDLDVNLGSWEWVEVTGDTTSNARVRLSSLSNPTVNDISDSNFTIDSPWHLYVTLTPHNIPIQIPAGGGSFEFDVEISNQDNFDYAIDFWTNVTLPSGYHYPILTRENLNLSAGGSIIREGLTQFVPGSALAGSYAYNAHVRDHNTWVVYAEDSFPFEKLPGTDSPNHNFGWALYGWDEDSQLPTKFVFNPPNPNPFNPETEFSFILPKAGNVSLVVYNILGGEVAQLFNGYYPPGFYQATFDASLLSSGIYFARLLANEFQETRKLLLIK